MTRALLRAGLVVLLVVVTRDRARLKRTNAALWIALERHWAALERHDRERGTLP